MMFVVNADECGYSVHVNEPIRLGHVTSITVMATFHSADNCRFGQEIRIGELVIWLWKTSSFFISCGCSISSRVPTLQQLLIFMFLMISW